MADDALDLSPIEVTPPDPQTLLPRVPGAYFDTPPGQVMTPGALRQPKPDDPERPGWWESLVAHYEYDNSIVSGLVNEQWGVDNSPDPDFEGSWDLIKDTKYEKYWDRFAHINNQSMHDAMVEQIEREEENRRIMDASPWYMSVPFTLGANFTDPSILIPGGAFIKSARGGLSVSRSALNVGTAATVSVAAQEAALQATQEMRSGAESGIYIGAAALLGGLLGAGGAAAFSRTKWQEAVTKLERDIEAGKNTVQPVPAPVGAAAGAQRVDPPDLDALTIAGTAAGKVAKATRFLNPNLRAQHVDSAVGRDVAQNLTEMTQYTRGMDEGLASAQAVETLRKEWNAGLMRAVDEQRSAWKDYRKRVGRGALTRHEFAEEVGRAGRRGDIHEIPEVERAARTWRSEVSDPMTKAAIEVGLLTQAEINQIGRFATSYFSRMPNLPKLIAEEHMFKAAVREWLEANPSKWANKEVTDIPQMARDVSDEVFNKYTGRGGETLQPYGLTIKARGPLKERTLMVPDEVLEPWLESNADLVWRRFQRILSADIELKKKFGSVDMADQIRDIRADYENLRAATTSQRELTRLSKQEKRLITDVEALRDLIRGTYKLSEWEDHYGTVSRLANMFNYIRSMGQITLSSLPEAYRTAMVHGLKPFFTTVNHALSGNPGYKMQIKEGKLAGNIGERALSHRLATLAEIGDFYTSRRGPLENLMANMVEVASSANGIRLYTDWMRMVATGATQNRILDAAVNYSRTTAENRRLLAYLGVNEEMAGRIADQFNRVGENIDGAHVANTLRWDDDAARTAFRAALNKDMDTQVITKSVGDIPVFANTPTGRMLFQFNTFNLASHQRILLRGLQEGPRRFVSGAIALTTIGMAITKLHSIAANRDVPEFAENPGWWIAEGIDRSGLIMVPMQLGNITELFTGVNPVKTPLKIFDESGHRSLRLNNRNIMSLLGPTAGLVRDITTVGGIPIRLATEDDPNLLDRLTQGQKNAGERLLPFNSYIALRQMLRYVINPPDAGKGAFN